MRWTKSLLASIHMLPVAWAWPGLAFSQTPPPKPNIIVILADDMGFADIGPYGGEIQTPNLDKLASQGIKFTQFYNNARCCPTRTSLLTGLYPHEAGMGWMETDQSAASGPGYTGGLNAHCATLAEVLKTAGYSTYMSGKWHVVSRTNIKSPASGGWPLQRGFDRFFGILAGASQFFDSPDLYNDDKPVRNPAGSYFTQDLSDSASAFIDRHAMTRANPFFLYLAYTAPHWPLQALRADIDKYRQRYLKGWDSLRAERYARQVESGLIKAEWNLSPRDGADWDTLSSGKRAEMALRMAIYAAQVDRMDQGIGKVMATLQARGLKENTLVFFLSDNGGNLEGGILGGGPASELETHPTLRELSYGQSWANASNVPFRAFKHYTHEGGISTPLIVSWPDGIARKGEWETQVSHLIDIMPTLMEVSGAVYPSVRKGQTVYPKKGTSLVPAFSRKALDRGGPLFWEHEGNRAVRDGKWKLVAVDKQAWELYDMEKDRVERNNLAKQNPALVKKMEDQWQAWAERSAVIRSPGSTVALAAASRPGIRPSEPGPAVSPGMRGSAVGPVWRGRNGNGRWRPDRGSEGAAR